MYTAERAQLLKAVSEVDRSGFESVARAVLAYQAARNPLYQRFLSLLRREPAQVHSLDEIPFLPISFFKTHAVKSGDWEQKDIFTSSGTTGQQPSTHYVRDPEWYLENTRRGFEAVCGDIRQWRVLALLPSYLERTGSSLVRMVEYFISRSELPGSGFFLNNTEHLAQTLRARRSGEQTLLLGVSFALLDFAELYPMDLHDVVVMETGGMKGRREEITREALHNILKNAFQCPQIHSEYGMTELFSQAYTAGGHFFKPAPTLRAVCTEINDPFAVCAPGKTGRLNFIDLANIDTCSFIATDDLGRVHPDGRFEVLGRLDNAEMRGCNLMVE